METPYPRSITLGNLRCFHVGWGQRFATIEVKPDP